MGGNITWKYEAENAKMLVHAFRALGETDAPYLREALDQGGKMLESAIQRRAKPGVASATRFVGTRGVRAELRAVVQIKHPAARSFEFGRDYYYRGYKGRAMKSGQRFRSRPGFRQQNLVGIIKGGGPLEEIIPRVTPLIAAAIDREIARLASGSAA